MKCSALLMLPGMASFSKSCDSTGISNMRSSPSVISFTVSPSTSFSYSSCNFLESVLFTSSTFLDSVLAPLDALFSMSLVKSNERDSIQTLSILCASSKMTMASLDNSLETLSEIFGSSK
ncbi:hypothetical protein WICPIJ_005124 [Wickerhamomyces pijperi]|uniref:Uncharacterized protein n=1 Tax=Wickerhamomyces pijperi TaxID=599730 RepID=A0A9P8Q6V9_WICPI|nr:hypothetical protein WICPIJ_005124 [Wickerhamomyces pijperi]